MYTSPNIDDSTSIDFAELNPGIMARVGTEESVGVTTSAGDSWWEGQVPEGASAGNIAVSADGGAFVWSTGEVGVHYSTTQGSTWEASAGVPDGALVQADRVNPGTFYAFSEGAFHVSHDQGATFTQTGANNLPEAGTRKFNAVPGREGDIWFAGGHEDGLYGLWRSTDGGATFTRFDNVEQANNVGFGKAAPGADYQAVYIIAQVNGVRGVFRSNDVGASWVRINDDDHQYGNFGEAITGDPRRYGRFYLGTNGRGVIYGDPVDGGGASSSSSAQSSSSVSSSESSSVSSAASSAPSSSSSSISSSVSSSTSSASSSSVAPESGLACSADLINDWGSGYQLEVTVSNPGDAPMEGWTLELTFAQRLTLPVAGMPSSASRAM